MKRTLYNSLKEVFLKTFLILTFFQYSNITAQNPILLDHTWYFEVGNVNNETLFTPEVPEEFPKNIPFESTLDFYLENGNAFFDIQHNYCSMYPIMQANFSNNESIFSANEYVVLDGFGCDYGEVDIFLSYILFSFGVYNEQVPNPFSYTIEEVENYYKLTITNNDGNWLIYNSILLSNPAFNENTLSLYPNPVQNILNIQNTASNLSKVQIYDLNGRLLQNHLMQSNEVSLDVSQLNSGIYFVILENEMGNQISRKIVKTGK